jgi:uncharacterized membrane protein YfcA
MPSAALSSLDEQASRPGTAGAGSLPAERAARTHSFQAVRRRVFLFSGLGLLAVLVLLALFEPQRPRATDVIARLLQRSAATSTVIDWGLAPALVTAGVVVGLFMGMLGMGGGVFKVSCMLLVFRMDIFFARAVSIITMFFASSTALLPHLSHRRILWAYAKPILLGAVPGAVAGALLGNSLQSQTLTHVFGFFTLFLAFSVLGLVFGDPDEGALVEVFSETPRPRQRRECAAVGVIHGFISGLLGISGGVIACPMQQMVLKLPLRDSITNTLLASTVVTGIASLIVVSVGVSRGDYSLAQIVFVDAFMGAGCAIGGWLGARLGKRCPITLLHLIDFVLVFGAGFSILF